MHGIAVYKLSVHHAVGFSIPGLPKTHIVERAKELCIDYLCAMARDCVCACFKDDK